MNVPEIINYEELKYDEITVENFDDINGCKIGWIKIFSCIEGVGMEDMNANINKSLISKLLPYAISLKIAPSGSINNTKYDRYAVITKPCSNPVFLLNYGYELSWRVDEQFNIIDDVDTSDWIGSAVAKERLETSCYRSSENPVLSNFFDSMYHCCTYRKNDAGIHIMPSMDLCKWSRYELFREDIEIYLGFANKTEYCNTPLIDECSNKTLNDCDINAKCIDLVDGYECECNYGFIGNGITCSLNEGMLYIFHYHK